MRLLIIRVHARNRTTRTNAIFDASASMCKFSIHANANMAAVAMPSEWEEGAEEEELEWQHNHRLYRQTRDWAFDTIPTYFNEYCKWSTTLILCATF